MIFPSTVAGIPCQIEVTEYHPGTPMRITGTGFGDAEPPEPRVFEFDVLDRNGRHAPWLEKKLTTADRERIEEEFTIMLRGEELAEAG